MTWQLQKLITCSKLVCSIRKNIYFFLNEKKIFIFCFFKKNDFFVKKYFGSSSAEEDLWKTTWLKISLPCTSLFCQKLREKKEKKKFFGKNEILFFLVANIFLVHLPWKMTWLKISLFCTSLMLVLPQCNFYFYSSKL